MDFTPIVLHSDDKGFCWRGSLGTRFIFDGTHCFKVETMDEGKTKFTQSERFQGVLVWPMVSIVNDTKKNFERMNEALKKRVENQ
jgi:hypothetical protein